MKKPQKKKPSLQGFPIFKEPTLPTPRQPGQKVPSYTNIPENRGTPEGLGTAPLPELLKTTSVGQLPMVSGDGRMPWKVYARPFEKITNQKSVSLSAVWDFILRPLISPFADYHRKSLCPLVLMPRNLISLIRKARSYGHEVMIDSTHGN